MDALGNEYLRGMLKTIVLTLLAEAGGRSAARPGRMYGYEITQAVNERTKGEITLSFGALYPVLHKLESDGLLTTETEEVDGRLRRYYSLTPQGDTASRQKIADFTRFVNAMRSLLNVPLGPTPSR